MPSSSSTIPMTFVRRTTTTVFLVFLVTMALFLAIAYRSEARHYARGVFEHLEETSAVLVSLPELLEPESRSETLASVERQLAERTGVPHRALVTDSGFRIIDASDEAVLGEDIRILLRLEPFQGVDPSRNTGRTGAGRWLVSTGQLATDRQLYLLRSDEQRSDFVKRFWGLHGLHVGVTLVLFYVLLRFLGERYIRRPIELLAGHVHRVEAGQFDSSPESFENDEFGWLAERFSHMGLSLQQTVRHLVRAEKYSAAVAVAYRAARESSLPLNDMNKHINRLEELVHEDSAAMRVLRSMQEDYRGLIRVLVRLQEITPAEDVEETEGGA